MELPFITAGDGCRLAYRFDGPEDAPVLLLSNSLGTDMHMWEPQLAAWTRAYRVLRYDQRGHGRSDAPAGAYSIDRLGRELASAVRALVRADGLMTRLHGTGVVATETAAALGALGVAARASGLGFDLRRDRPYGAYRDLEVPLVTNSQGDVAARFHVRAQEAHESLGLLRTVLSVLPDGPVGVPLASTPPAGESTLGS